MRLSHLFAISILAGSVFAACGGDDGDGGGGGVDAAITVDAAPDAPAALTGLGQRCVPAMDGADCPTNAPGCISFAQGATTGICTAICVIDGTMMTNANGAIMTVTPDPTAGPQASICTGAYTGTVGTPICASLLNGGALGYMPADNPLKPDSTYTNVHVACAIGCGANDTCPSGLAPSGTGAQCRCQ